MYICGLIWTSIPLILCRDCAIERLKQSGHWNKDKTRNENLLDYANMKYLRYDETLDDSDNVSCIYDFHESYEDLTCNGCLERVAQ